MIGAAEILKAKILVVDDKDANVRLIEGMLRVAGYTSVHSTTNPSKVCDLHRENRYSLILLDLQMPGMDGFGFVARTRADPVLCETPAILVTSRGSVEDRQRGRDAGASGYIVKGEFDQGHILQTIRDLIGTGK